MPSSAVPNFSKQSCKAQGLLTDFRFSFQGSSRTFGELLIYKKKTSQVCGERVTVEDVQGGQEGSSEIRLRGIGGLVRLQNLGSWLVSVGMVGV